ncbi:unnamed protein product, partial [Heterotrigona itama]
INWPGLLFIKGMPVLHNVTAIRTIWTGNFTSSRTVNSYQSFNATEDLSSFSSLYTVDNSR